MAYADLTEDQKAVLDDFQLLVRQWCMEQGKTLPLADNIQSDYANRVTAILTELVDGDEIPKNTGLDGAETLTKAELVTIVNYLIGVRTDYGTGTHRGNMARGCGSRNMLRG